MVVMVDSGVSLMYFSCLFNNRCRICVRGFGQARGIAEACTNHHPDNIIPQIMLRLQAKQEQHKVLASVRKGDSQVSHVANDLPQLPATRVKTSFVQHREDSWQIHLQRISPFLVAGVDVWWSYTPNGFLFHDGDTDPANPGDTFSLLHHRCHSVKDVEHRRDACWKRIVDEQIAMPAHIIKLYDSEGNKTGRLLYSDHTVTLECTSTDPLDTSTIEAEASHNSSTPTSETVSPVCVWPPADAPSIEVCPAVDCSPGLSSFASEGVEVRATLEARGSLMEVSGAHEDTDADEAAGSTDLDSNTTPLNNVVAEMCSSGPSSSSYINLNLEEHHEGLKTSAGNSIKRLLGCDDDLVKFDDLRFKLKKAKRAGKHINMTTSISRY